MEKTVFKIFFSKIKERKWLDKMGSEGYLLNRISDSKYYFTYSKNHKYSYSIEYLDCSPQSDDALEYYKTREIDGVYPILSSGNWIYFYKQDGNITRTIETYKKNSSFYFWRMIYLGFFAVTGAVITGYQAYATKYLPYVEHSSDGRLTLISINQDASSVFEKFLNFFKVLINGMFEWLNNGYIKIYTNIFGECDAAIVIAFMVPIVLVLSILFALNFDQYLSHKVLSNYHKKDENNKKLSRKVFGRR